MSGQSVAQKICAKIYFQELAASRALGKADVECYTSAFIAMTAVYEIAFTPDRPAILTRFRPYPLKGN